MGITELCTCFVWQTVTWTRPLSLLTVTQPSSINYCKLKLTTAAPTLWWQKFLPTHEEETSSTLHSAVLFETCQRWGQLWLSIIFWHKNRERKSITFQYKALRSQLSILACTICTVLGLENLQWSFWLIQLIYVFQFRASELDITPVSMDWQHMVPFGVSQCNLICFAFTHV